LYFFLEAGKEGGMNFSSLLDLGVKKGLQDVAVVHRGDYLRYVDLLAAAELLAEELRRLGVEKGAPVGLLCPNGLEHVVATFAVMRAGGICFYIPPGSTGDEVANLVGEMPLDAFCYSPRFGGLIPRPEDDKRRVDVIPGGHALVLKRAQNRTSQSEREQLVKINAAHIRFSSGTTGKAKGIIVSHESLVERAKIHYEAPPLEKGDTVLWLQPMARLPGPLAHLVHGAKLVIGDAMDTRSLARLIQEHGVTHIYTVPMFYRTILNEEALEAEDFRHVRYFLSGGSSLGRQLADAFAARYGREIVEHYGLAECGTVFINLGQDRSKRGSIGVPVRADVKLVSLDRDQLEREATGELLVRCPGLFEGYYKPWRPRAEVLENGWFRTGDIARRDADGYYWIVGRAKEVIDVGGVKVFPYEIEELLLSHPAVEEAVVVPFR
jgi:long-chain acyl-CoA synthetase